MSRRCAICEVLCRPFHVDFTDTRFGIPGQWAAARCPRCGLVRLIDPPSPDELDRLYEAHYNFGGESQTAYTRLRERFLLSGLYRLWLKLDGDVSFHALEGAGRLLDVGCNEGRGLELYRRNGFHAEGLEINPRAARTARAKGFEVHEGKLEDFRPREPYQVVVLSNVLEHCPDPLSMLRHVHRMLEPGGRVWIGCPNARSAWMPLFGRYWIHWHPPFHLFQFSPDSLARLLREAGFRVEALRHVTPALWVAHSVIAALFARPGRPTRELRKALLVGPLTLAVRLAGFPFLCLSDRLGRGDGLVVEAVRER